MLATHRSAPLVVAIPARNEAQRIAACLEALDQQQDARFDHVVLLVNNSDDGTAEIARAVKIDPATTLHVLERDFPPAQASAGHARRAAMQEAAALAGPDGVLFTTDADGLVDHDWLAQTLAALDHGADVVAGWVELHPIEWGQIPATLHEDDARECAYDALCDEIHAKLDPDPVDPEPRHTQHSGASIAVTAEAFARCGGVPAIASGEDRALIAALRRVDARVRHAPGVHVTVSGRTVGRSAGGMADTIRRRLDRPDAFLDDRLEPAIVCARRAICRALARRAYDDHAFSERLNAQVLLPPELLAEALGQPYFGIAWDMIEAASPLLRRQLVAVGDLPEQMRLAAAILAPLRQAAHLADRSDTASAAAAELA